VESEVFAQHRRLDVLFEEVLDSFRPEGPPEATHEALKELREALETHFDQEDRLYYPAIWALRPDLKPQLKTLVDAHGEFLAQLDRLETLQDRGERAEARSVFDYLSAVFKRHEDAEEAALATLHREIDAAR
jgi:hemerythrin